MAMFSFSYQKWWIPGTVRKEPELVDGLPQFVADGESFPDLVGTGPTMQAAVAAFREGLPQWIEDHPDHRKNLIPRVQPTSPGDRR